MRIGTGRMAALGLALSACGGAADRMPAADPRLDGEWAVEFRLEHPIRLREDPAAAGTVRGQITLIDNHVLRGADGLDGPPTHYGAYAADFAPFGFGRAGRGRVPTAAALARADSVRIALAPESGDGPVLAGALAGDSIAGRWWYRSGRSGEAAGRFVMRRR